MKNILITTIAAVALATTALADPIHDAARNGDLDGVQAELDKGADVNAKIEGGTTPLFLATLEGHKEIVELLIAKGADVNAKDRGGSTPLNGAAWESRNEIAELLIAAGADVNAKDDYGGNTPLYDAAYTGHKEIVELLIAKGADVNAKNDGGSTPLHGAAGRDRKEIVELLIANGADVNAKDEDGLTPLDLAVRGHGDIGNKIADLLRKHGGKESPKKPRVSIHVAARDGNIKAVKQHLAYGTDVNVRDVVGTPLHYATYGGRKEVVELLIDSGADVNAKDVGGWTPLHMAAGDHKEIAELLIAEGADVNAKNDDGETPLDLVGTRKSWARLLRKHGGKTAKELALMPRLTYSRGLFEFSFTAMDGVTYVVEVTQDFKQWGELETIEGTGKQIEFTDPRQPLVPFKRNFYRVKVVE